MGQGCIPLFAPSDSQPHEGKTPVGHVSIALPLPGVSTTQGHSEGSDIGDTGMGLGPVGKSPPTRLSLGRRVGSRHRGPHLLHLPVPPVSPGQVGRVSTCSAVVGLHFSLP